VTFELQPFEWVDVLIYAATLPAVVFPVLYASRSNWRATLPGRALMQLSIALAVVLVLVSLATLFGNFYPYREAVRFAAYLFLVVSLWRQVITLLRLQNVQQGEIRRERARVLDNR